MGILNFNRLPETMGEGDFVFSAQTEKKEDPSKY